MLLSNAGASSMPVIANLYQCRHQYVPQKVEGTGDGSEASELMVDPRRIEVVQRRAERRGIERHPPLRLDERDNSRASRDGETAQVNVSQPGEAADAVSLIDGLTYQPQARDVGVRVHPAAIVSDGVHSAMTALPCAQRVDGDSGQPRDGADRIVRA